MVIAYIDFGMMDQLDELRKKRWWMHCASNKDYTDLAEDFVKLGFLTPETDIRPIVPALEAVLGNAISESGNFNFKTITDSFGIDVPISLPSSGAVCLDYPFSGDTGRHCTQPQPHFKIVEVAYPYVAGRLLTGETPEFRRRLLNVLFKDGKFQWQRLRT